MDKQTNINWQKIIKIFIKLFILFIMFGLMLIDWMIVQPIPHHILYTYGFVMFVCLASFGLTIFPKIRKICYILFFISLVAYICMYNFTPNIKEQHLVDGCMDLGNVWDYNEHRCRTDCWRWTFEKGCEKE